MLSPIRNAAIFSSMTSGCSKSGGKGKTFDQIKDDPDSFVVNDGVEMTRGNKIPLWLFGFLY